MALCVLGRESLGELEDLVRTHFADLRSTAPPGEPAVAPFDALGAAFDAGAFHQHVIVDPVADTHDLDMMWVLPSLHAAYRTRPDVYVAEMLGHEGMYTCWVAAGYGVGCGSLFHCVVYVRRAAMSLVWFLTRLTCRGEVAAVPQVAR